MDDGAYSGMLPLANAGGFMAYFCLLGGGVLAVRGSAWVVLDDFIGLIPSAGKSGVQVGRRPV